MHGTRCAHVPGTKCTRTGPLQRVGNNGRSCRSSATEEPNGRWSTKGGADMCITASVGRLGINSPEDVKTVQVLLNLNLSQLTPLAVIAESGRTNIATFEGIEYFQARSRACDGSNGLVAVDSRTLQALRAGMPAGFVQGKLQGIMIRAPAPAVKTYFALFVQGMARSQINTPRRMAHFLAQLAHESAQLRRTSEIASGAGYEGREALGNTQPGDGRRFKGRGLIQITGRANYEAYGRFRRVDYTTDATSTLLATDPATSLDSACWFWRTRSLNGLADADNLNAITKRINGGTIGLTERRELLQRARFFMEPPP